MIETKITLATHNGRFHADEVSAIALLHIFEKIKIDEIILTRTRDEEQIAKADIVLDVGGIFSPDIMRFDHHQIKNGTKSTAGMIWDHIKSLSPIVYPEIEQLINKIDAHDCGVCPMPDFSYAHIISTYNTDDTYNDLAQDTAFLEAVNVAMKLFENLKKTQEQKVKTLEIIANATVEKIGKNEVMIFDEYCPNWSDVIHGNSKYSNISRVIWYVSKRDQWSVQVPARDKKVFELIHDRLKEDPKAHFIHQNGFLGVYKEKADLLNMLLRE